MVGTYSVGGGPYSICFDGGNIWVTNWFSENVTKLRASDGSMVGTYGTGDGPQDICFDGENIWVNNYNSDNVTYILVN